MRERISTPWQDIAVDFRKKQRKRKRVILRLTDSGKVHKTGSDERFQNVAEVKKHSEIICTLQEG